MPIYTYRHQAPAEINDALPVHGDFETHAENERRAAFGLPGMWPARSARYQFARPRHHQWQHSKLSDAAINRSGMTKYVNIGNGKYEKAAGPSEAPSVIDRNRLPD